MLFGLRDGALVVPLLILGRTTDLVETLSFGIRFYSHIRISFLFSFFLSFFVYCCGLCFYVLVWVCGNIQTWPIFLFTSSIM